MPEEVFVLAVLAVISVTTVAFGVMRSINRHLDRKWRGRGGGDEKMLGELEDLRERVESAVDLQERVSELEERVDFTERLLAAAKDRRLSPGPSERA